MTKAFILALLVGFMALGYGLVEWAQPVKAAESDACEKVGSTGAIVVYFCQPDNGPAFLVNNVGFMAVVE